MRNLHKLESLIASQRWSQSKFRVREGERKHTQKHNTSTHAREAKTRARVQDHTRTTQNWRSNLSQITRGRDHRVLKCWCVLEMFEYWYEAPGVPFVVTRGLGAFAILTWKPKKLPCLRGQSGAPLDRVCAPQSRIWFDAFLIVTNTRLGPCTTGPDDDVS
jgi:hypothetical protein